MRYSATMLEVHRIRAISLDLDDTLWPILPTIRRAEAVLGQWLKAHAPRTARLLGEPGALLRIRHAVLDEFGRRQPSMAHDFSAMRVESIRRALLEAGEDGALALPAFEVFFAERQRVDLYDDALHALDFLSARFPVVALSNGNADVFRVGIGRYFAASLSARELGLGKPDARAFQAAATSVGVALDEVLHVGDDIELDALGALRAGMQSIWLNRGGLDWPHDELPHATVRDLRQLCAMLA
jgi:HAD superfamily hydrolase (TIGR01549 family)